MSNSKTLPEPMFAIIHITWQAPNELFMFLWQCDRDVACFEGANEKLLACDDEVECQMFLLHFVARSKRQLPSKMLCLSILGILYNHVLIMISHSLWRHCNDWEFSMWFLWVHPWGISPKPKKGLTWQYQTELIIWKDWCQGLQKKWPFMQELKKYFIFGIHAARQYLVHEFSIYATIRVWIGAVPITKIHTVF